LRLCVGLASVTTWVACGDGSSSGVSNSGRAGGSAGASGEASSGESGSGGTGGRSGDTAGASGEASFSESGGGSGGASGGSMNAGAAGEPATGTGGTAGEAGAGDSTGGVSGRAGGGGAGYSGGAAGERGSTTDFDGCLEDLDCASPDSDCASVSFLPGEPRLCMPRCELSSDCPFNTVCYPEGGGIWGAAAAGLEDHCYRSFCGESLSAGTASGACTLGSELGLFLGSDYAGWCRPTEDGVLGTCERLGTAAVASACDGGSAAASCGADAVCVDQAGTGSETCRLRCDPVAVLTGDETDCEGTGGECRDASLAAPTRATLGYCDAVVACSLIGPNTCPDNAGQAQACMPTNAVRATGVCSTLATGGLVAGEACGSDPSGPLERCEAGTLCVDAICRPLCNTPSNQSGGPDFDCTTFSAATACRHRV
jgi:hypothetical protein